jgi:DNA-binding response OmpR family regulator
MMIRILFVEKDLTTADLLVPSLERKGYQVTLAHTQRQATSRIRTSRPDLLIIDVASFGPGGYRVSEALRDQLQGTATILLLPDGHDTAGSTADAFMTPPFTSRRLLYRVGQLARELPSREIRVGDLVLDPDLRILHKGELTERLRPKEAMLLALLMCNRGRVLSRREIMDRVWQTDYMEDTRTLNVHIRWLRLKIEDDPDHPCYLRTVRGVGYRFDVPESSADLTPADTVVQ